MPSYGGSAYLPISDRYVYLSESRQTVIAAWNGTEEVLILTAEPASSRETKVIRFIPFPTKPTVEDVPSAILDRIQKLIARNAPKIGVFVDGRRTNKSAVIGIDLMIETKLGPHNIAVVKIESTEAFDQWITDYLKKQGIKDPAPDTGRYKAVVNDYLARNIKYFVFDVVTVPEKPTAINPLAFTFETDSLFVPFVISSRNSGSPQVDLFLVTPGAPKKWVIPSAFSPVTYKFPEGIDFSKNPGIVEKYNLMTFSPDHPVAFPMSLLDRVFLSPLIARVIPGWKTKAYFTALRYKGSLSYLGSDIMLTAADLQSPDFDAVKKAVSDADEFRERVPEDIFDMVAGPSAVPFVTGGTDAYTSRAAVDGDPSTPYILPLKGEWTIDLSDRRRIEGIEIIAAVTKPDIVPSKNKLYLYASDTGEFKGEERRVDTCVVRSSTSTRDVDDPSRRAEKVVLTDRTFSARWLKIKYSYSESISNLYLFEVMIWGDKER